MIIKICEFIIFLQKLFIKNITVITAQFAQCLICEWSRECQGSIINSLLTVHQNK